MVTVTATIPRMLAELVGGSRSFELDAATLTEGLEALFSRHPELKIHLLDERGRLRRHVLLFHNDTSIDTTDAPLADGDTLTILQAVSGG